MKSIFLSRQRRATFPPKPTTSGATYISLFPLKISNPWVLRASKMTNAAPRSKAYEIHGSTTDRTNRHTSAILKMAGTRAKQALSKFSLLLCLFLIFCQFNYDITIHKSSIYMMVSAGYDAKFYLGRNDGLRRSRYVVSDTTVPSLKGYRILKITQLSLCAAGLILLAGDICPQPGPTFQLNNSGLSFGPKSRG